MNHALSIDNERYLADAVAKGLYPDRAQALDAAVRLLRQRDQLRAAVQAGIDQADRGELIPAEVVFARLEQRALAIEQNDCRAISTNASGDSGS